MTTLLRAAGLILLGFVVGTMFDHEPVEAEGAMNTAMFVQKVMINGQEIKPVNGVISLHFQEQPQSFFVSVIAIPDREGRKSSATIFIPVK